MLQLHEDQVERVNKDVVVIGNGPSGICLSYLLAGNWPHYTCKDHPGDEMLTARLRYTIASLESSADRSSCSSVSEEDDDEEDNDSNDSFSSLPRDDDDDDDDDDNRRAQDEDAAISCRCCQRLQNRHCLPLGMSKPEQLELLASGLEGRNSGKPLSLLMDNLQHPCLDAGLDVPSLLDWKSPQEHREHRPIDHVVLGKGPPGGIWHSLDPSVLTISLMRWMSLPGLDLRDWLASLDQDERRRLQIATEQQENDDNSNSTSKERVPIGAVAAYYRDYVARHGLDKHFRSGSVVTSVKPLRRGGSEEEEEEEDDDEEYRWLVEGYEYESGRQFRYRSKRVVLATGTTDSYNRLGCSGEDSYNWVAHDFKAFRRKLERTRGSCCQLQQRLCPSSSPEPVLVVGSGLSAADAIMAARSRGVPVVHVFRSSSSSPSSSSSSSSSSTSKSRYDKVQWLPASAYPEYHKVYEMMAEHRNNRKYPLYTPLADHVVVDFSSSCDRFARAKTRKVTLCSPQGRLLTLRVSCAAVLIGSKPDLSYLENNGTDLGKFVDRPIDSHANPINVNVYTYEVEQAARRGLYAVGPLVGDNFVRFILGGAYGVFADILNNQYS